MKLGKIIREKRQELEVSLVQLADLLNISQAYMSDIENGKRNVGNYNLFCNLVEILSLQDRKKELFYKLCEERGNIEFEYIKEMGV